MVVATDFSDGAAVAEDYALALAAALGARLHVLHVVSGLPLAEELGAEAVSELLERAEREARHRLESWISVGDRRRLEAITGLARGVPEAEIVQYAGAHDIDLIVMGGCGQSGPKPSRLGHVTVGVLQKARCPVLAVDCRLRSPRGAAPASEPSSETKKTAP